MTRKKEDRLVTVTKKLGSELFEGTPKSIIDSINTIQKEALENGMVGDGYFEIEVEEEPYSDCQIAVVEFRYYRKETPEEKNQRLAEDERRKQAAKEERQRKTKLKKDPEFQEFQRLKEKFEAKKR